MTLVDHGGLQPALQHERALRRLAAALLRDPADADDAVQHALVQEATGRRRQGAPLWPFLCATLRHHAQNLRKLARRRQGRERAAARPEPVPAADEMLQREQLRRRVADAVLALDEPYRTTVWLRWFEELPADAVAARMQVPLPTVRTRLQRAHQELRRRLDRDYGDRRWAALAVPTAGAVAIPLAVGAGALLMAKKIVVAVAVVLLAGVGYALLPGAARPREAVPVAGVPAPGRVDAADRADEANQRRELATPPAMAVSSAAGALRLAVVQADGTPAIGLPVWTWADAATRPMWTRRCERTGADWGWPAGIGPVDHGEPPPAPMHTDGTGRVELPAGVIAVTVECAPGLWFSAGLPAGGAPLVLPELVPVEAAMLGGPPGGAWAGWVNAAWIEADGSDNHGRMRTNLTTRSGPGVLRIGGRVIELQIGEQLRALMPRGQLCAVACWGHGFEVENTVAMVTAPGAAVFRAAGPLPVVQVAVVEPDGTPSAVAGVAGLRLANGSGVEAVQRGVATFDTYEIEPGRHAIEVLLEDGTLLRGEVECAGGGERLQVAVPRAAGTPPVRVPLPDLPADGIAAILIEDPAGALLRAMSQDGVFCFEREPLFRRSSDGLLLNRMPAGWIRGLLVARDGRVGQFAPRVADDAVALQWLAATPPRTLDLTDLYHELGDLPNMLARVDVALENSRGAVTWVDVTFHRRSTWQEQPEPPPVFADLRLPQALRARLVVLGAAAGQYRLLRELELPRR